MRQKQSPRWSKILPTPMASLLPAAANKSEQIINNLFIHRPQNVGTSAPVPRPDRLLGLDEWVDE
ncbi:hypothetical protein BC938DRAFT_471996 [Jimgerdemannia flammicorona]|uniref:Uncharacterized protein n=1 Tax=Jimgerdemannia flammicorona TaxID=994334 RepID=A0A433Q6Z3_9FUNG|nr:hypothetical protein BC938DRAFT_471996 [Jimgerdemannia flammicorona]